MIVGLSSRRVKRNLGCLVTKQRWLVGISIPKARAFSSVLFGRCSVLPAADVSGPAVGRRPYYRIAGAVDAEAPSPRAYVQITFQTPYARQSDPERLQPHNKLRPPLSRSFQLSSSSVGSISAQAGSPGPCPLTGWKLWNGIHSFYGASSRQRGAGQPTW